MKPARTGAISGCIIWFIVFALLSTCLLPVGMAIGGFTSVTDFAMQTLEPLICPDGTTAKSRSYATTTTDDFGNSQPSTAYVMQCVDTNGEVVKEDPVVYAFVWIGIIAGIGLALAGILAFVFAAPAGVIVTRLLNRNKKASHIINIEPE
jgi:hypothetical protein